MPLQVTDIKAVYNILVFQPVPLDSWYPEFLVGRDGVRNGRLQAFDFRRLRQERPPQRQALRPGQALRQARTYPARPAHWQQAVELAGVWSGWPRWPA